MKEQFSVLSFENFKWLILTTYVVSVDSAIRQRIHHPIVYRLNGKCDTDSIMYSYKYVNMI